MRPVRWHANDLLDRLDDVMEVYGEAMGYPAELLATRRAHIASHVRRVSFNAVATLDSRGRLLGFGYGYRSMAGQWWHDQVRAGVRRDRRSAWLADCFEVVELHVHPEAQGRGIGASQLTGLLAPVVESRVLLSTPEADERVSRAWRLYRRFGFVDVLRHFRFPGDDRPFAILGRGLPLRPDTTEGVSGGPRQSATRSGPRSGRASVGPDTGVVSGLTDNAAGRRPGPSPAGEDPPDTA